MTRPVRPRLRAPPQAAGSLGSLRLLHLLRARLQPQCLSLRPAASGPTWQNRSYRQYQPYQPGPAPVRPPRPRRPGPGSSVSLAVLGLGLLAGAGVWYATATHHVGLLQGQFILIGTLVALLGAGIFISGLRRRHGAG